MTTFDPEWEDDDTEAALEFDADERARCECGQYLADTSGPDIETNRFYAERIVCKACEAVGRARRADSQEKKSSEGVKYQVRDRAAQ